jgi:hypothetical protein
VTKDIVAAQVVLYETVTSTLCIEPFDNSRVARSFYFFIHSHVVSTSFRVNARW